MSSKEKKVMILTEYDFDPHAIVVKNKLEKIGESVVVIDPGKLPVASHMTFTINKDCFSQFITIDDRRLSADDIKSVWYRRPTTLQIPENTHPDYLEVVHNEWRTFINSLWKFMESPLWVSTPPAIRQAELKPILLSIARKFGLNIPDTLVTNDIETAYDFYLKCQKRIIVKKLYSHMVSHDKRPFLFTTHLMKNISKRKLDGLKIAPCILQEYIEKKLELRITVIGEEVLAVSIDSQSGERTKIDWRAGREETFGLKHSIYSIPYYIAESCKKVVKEFGLMFGAIDMILTPDDKYIFLELNPNGQWLWLERLTGAPLSNAMVKLLSCSA